MHEPIHDDQQLIQNQIDRINALHIPGYKKEVLTFIDNTNDLEVLDRNGDEGRNLLYHACMKENTEIALALINRGVDVNYRSKGNFNNSVLSCACENGLEDVALLLIEKGANVNAASINGNTPLIGACENSLEEVAMSLIKKGAYVDVEDLNENTPLILACENGVEDVAMAIIKKGNIEKQAYSANNKIGLLSAQNPIGNTPLHYACLTGLKEVVKIILKKHPHLLLSTNSISATPVHFAITYTNKTNDTSIIDMIMVTNKNFTVERLEEYKLEQKMIEKIMLRKAEYSGVLSKMSTDVIGVMGEFVSEDPEQTSPSKKKRRTGGKTKRRRKTKRSKKRKSRRKKD